LRMTLNCGFAIGILTFFVSNSFWGLVIGAIIFGISNAGGDVAWSLWVTKFAPPGRVADYMSVHTFFTGVRGVLAPLVAFTLVQQLPVFLRSNITFIEKLPPQTVDKISVGILAAFSALLILAATLLLLPEIKFGKRGRKGIALVEEVSD
jgi:MFS family permease